jgi:hypothetical protein
VPDAVDRRGTAIGIASAVIGFRAVRTLWLLLRGRLLPAA